MGSGGDNWTTELLFIFYLLNTQLVQDIIKNMYTHRNEKKYIKHWKKAYTYKNTIKSKA